MATLITSKSDGPLNLPAQYGSLCLAPKTEAIIADTPTNVAAVLSNWPSSVAQLSTTADGQAGAVTPSSAPQTTVSQTSAPTVSSPLVLTGAQSGTRFNTGASPSAAVGFTLPVAVVGMKFSFSSQCSSGWEVLPGNATDTIQYLTNTSTASTGNCHGSSNGACATLECWGAGTWIVTAALGTVAVA